MKQSSKFVSALSALQPVSIVNVDSGEYLSKSEYEPSIRGLIDYVTRATRALYAENTAKLHADLESFKGSANSFGRQKGYRIDYAELPGKVKAKSRVQELVLHKLISETAAYVLNPNPSKQAPSFTGKVNLGAVNAQMASLYREPDSTSLYLKWKCWDQELLIEFNIPSYILKRDIIKWSLPTVQYSKSGEIAFYFTVQEGIPERNGEQSAGLDVGVIELYTTAIVNKNGARIADYHSSPYVKQLQRRMKRLIKEKACLSKKITTYSAYGMDSTILEVHRSHLSAKITRQGKNLALQASAELTGKLVKHSVNILHVEKLNWITGSKDSKIGSNHSFQHARLQSAIEHANLRHGIRVKKVSARNTSQECHSCKNLITHNSRKRSVYCSECKSTLDRDFNAAMNIAKSIPFKHGFEGRKASCKAPYGEESESTRVHSQSLVQEVILTRIVT